MNDQNIKRCTGEVGKTPGYFMAYHLAFWKRTVLMNWLKALKFNNKSILALKFKFD